MVRGTVTDETTGKKLINVFAARTGIQNGTETKYARKVVQKYCKICAQISKRKI